MKSNIAAEFEVSDEGRVKALPMDKVLGLTLPSEGGAGEQNLFVDPTAEMPSPAAWGGVRARVALSGEPPARSSAVSGGPICVCTFFLCKVLVVSRLAQELEMDVGKLVTGADPLCAQETGPATFSVLTMVPMV